MAGDIYEGLFSNDVYNIPPNLLNNYYGDVVIKGPGKTYKYSGDVFNILALFLSNRDNKYFLDEVDKQMAIALANYINNNKTSGLSSVFVGELRQILKEKQSGRRPRTKKRDKYNLLSITDSMFFEAEPNPKRRKTGITVGRVYYALKYRPGSKGSLFHLYDQGWIPFPEKKRKMGLGGHIKKVEPFLFFIGNKKLMNKFETLFNNIVTIKPEIFKDVLSSIDLNVVIKKMAKDEILKQKVYNMTNTFCIIKQEEVTMARYVLKKWMDMQSALAMAALKTNITSETLAAILADSYGDMRADIIINSLFSDDINVKKDDYNYKGDKIVKNLNLSGLSSVKYLMESYFTALSTSNMKRIDLDYNNLISQSMMNSNNILLSSMDIVNEYNYLHQLNKGLDFIEGVQANNDTAAVESALLRYITNEDIKKNYPIGRISHMDEILNFAQNLIWKNEKIDAYELSDIYEKHTTAMSNRIHSVVVDNLKEIKEQNEDVILETIVKDGEAVKQLKDLNDSKIYDLKEQIKSYMIWSQYQKELEVQQREEEEKLREAKALEAAKIDAKDVSLEEIDVNNIDNTPTVQIDLGDLSGLEDLFDESNDINIVQDI